MDCALLLTQSILHYPTLEKKFNRLNVEQNCVLGLMDEFDFVQQETQINHDDILYLYTDGVTRR